MTISAIIYLDLSLEQAFGKVGPTGYSLRNTGEGPYSDTFIFSHFFLKLNRFNRLLFKSK